MKEIPFLAIGNDELANCSPASKGDKVRCRVKGCRKKHVLKCGIESKTREESNMLLFYKCGRHSYLAAVAGKLI